MMDLVPDAAMCTEISIPMKNFAWDARIAPGLLQEMLNNNDLEEPEIISIIFLMTDKDTNFSKVIEDVNNDPCTAFINLIEKPMWKEKLVESLFVIGNKEILGKLRFSNKKIQDMENLFVTKQHNVSSYINRAVKSLYFLCNSLTSDKVIKLVSEANKRLKEPLDLNTNKPYLEIYILKMLQQKYISIDPDKTDLSNLLKNVKSSGCLFDLPFDFDVWEVQSPNPIINNNERDSQRYRQTSQCESLSYSNSNGSLLSTEDAKWHDPNHEKLCIIINQINFIDTEKYQTREGSEVDKKSLEQTFSGCGFKIKNHQNYTTEDMKILLESLNSEEYSKYGVIFMCILSHGFEGEIVCADDISIKISTIVEKFCCRKLQNVFKCLILQSCQGKQKGLVDKLLVMDGPTNPLPHKHFLLFQATINNFAAMRHKLQGSWFIQDLCQEIREADEPIDIQKLFQKVKLRVSSRKAPADDIFQEYVQLPNVSMDTSMIPYELPKFQKSLTLYQNN